ncbi:hypothetical protein C3K23_00460 (plasmid) [Streptomyces sp. 604F]|nr:hypothetical protein B9S66_31000 [Streptomyces sp. SM17]QHV83501.1 hypothetical protein C3K23_00460 [Streptomyces sp. 604F]
MRGRRRHRGRRRRPPRSIPAGAGPTTATSRSAGPKMEHPRACGADTGHAPSSVTPYGASPRMRGRRPSSARTTWPGRPRRFRRPSTLVSR